MEIRKHDKLIKEIADEVIRKLKKDEVFAEKYAYERSTISDVVTDKKGNIIRFVNEREMQDA